MSDENASVKLPTTKVARRYGVTPRSIERWEADEQLGFPKALRINTRKYWSLGDLEIWERQRAAAEPAPKRAAPTKPTPDAAPAAQPESVS